MQPGVYDVHLPIMLENEGQAVYRERKEKDCLILQEDLDSLGLWEADWQMKFNVAKCHSMSITNTNKSFMATLCISKLWKTFSPLIILV